MVCAQHELCQFVSHFGLQWYKLGDAGYFDEEGFMYVMTRTDDIINVSGHRLATSQMEEVVASHSDVAGISVLSYSIAGWGGRWPGGFLHPCLPAWPGWLLCTGLCVRQYESV